MNNTEFGYLISILALGMLCAAWIGVQLLARRVGTRHQLGDRSEGGCGRCGCQSCEREPHG